MSLSLGEAYICVFSRRGRRLYGMTGGWSIWLSRYARLARVDGWRCIPYLTRALQCIISTRTPQLTPQKSFCSAPGSYPVVRIPCTSLYAYTETGYAGGPGVRPVASEVGLATASTFDLSFDGTAVGDWRRSEWFLARKRYASLCLPLSVSFFTGAPCFDKLSHLPRASLAPTTTHRHPVHPPIPPLSVVAPRDVPQHISPFPRNDLRRRPNRDAQLL